MSLSLVTPPAVEPVTLAEAKASLRVSHNDDDADIQSLIAAARLRIERVTGRQLVLSTWDRRLDGFPCEYEIRLPKPPLVSVTSISYVDTAGVTQTWGSSNYQVDAPAGPTAARGRIQPAYATSWPTTRTDTLNAVVVRFAAGYGTKTTDVPDDLRRAALLLVAGWFQDDDTSLTRAMSLMTPYKTFE